MDYVVRIWPGTGGEESDINSLYVRWRDRIMSEKYYDFKVFNRRDFSRSLIATWGFRIFYPLKL